MLVTNNPFAGNGKLLLGRRAEKDLFEQRVIKNAQSLAIVGLPCIGKTGLVNAILDSQKHVLQEKRIIYIEISLTADEFRSQRSLFCLLVKRCKKELIRASLLSDAARDAANMVSQEEEEYDFNDVKAFFEQVSADKIHIIVIIDKFDHVSRLFPLFPGNVQLFQGLEDLNITIVTLSFRPLSEIAAHMRAISDFQKKFVTRYLSPFNDDEMEKFYQMLASVSDGVEVFPVTPALREKFDFYCGRHPYLLNQLAYELVEIFLDVGVVDIDTSAVDLEPLSKYITMLINTMEEAKRLHAECTLASKLTQAIFGPAIDLTQKDTQELLLYGLIKPSTPFLQQHYGIMGEYVAFCDQLQRYLQRQDPLSALALEVGKVYWDVYRIEHIGKPTGHSLVVKAWDIQLQRCVAIKFIHPSLNVEEEVEKQLMREGSIAARLEHPHIAKVYHTRDKPRALIMEWIDGESLDDLMSQNTSAMDTQTVVKIGMDLAQALGHAHSKGITHRDIKPSNVIINQKGEAVLIDFDIARSQQHYTIAASKYVGTHNYSAPEHYSSPDQVGPPADIFALGIVLYEALTKKRPYLYNNPASNKGKFDPPAQFTIPDTLYQILCAALCQEPERRLNASELYQQLYIYYYAILGEKDAKN